jgi:hypothetical protein
MSVTLHLPPLYSFTAWTEEIFSSYSIYEKTASVPLHGVKTLSRRFLLSN